MLFSIFDVLSTGVLIAVVTLIVKCALLLRTRWKFQRLKDFPDHPRGIFFVGHAKAVSIIFLFKIKVGS